jgi:hypothetical protein
MELGNNIFTSISTRAWRGPAGVIHGSGVVAPRSPFIPGWFSWETQGAGVAVADITTNLIAQMVDTPPGQNQELYRIGRKSRVTGGNCGDVGRTAKTDIRYSPRQGERK